jgi:mycofactocin precursor
MDAVTIDPRSDLATDAPAAPAAVDGPAADDRELVEEELLVEEVSIDGMCGVY